MLSTNCMPRRFNLCFLDSHDQHTPSGQAEDPRVVIHLKSSTTCNPAPALCCELRFSKRVHPFFSRVFKLMKRAEVNGLGLIRTPLAFTPLMR